MPVMLTLEPLGATPKPVPPHMRSWRARAPPSSRAASLETPASRGRGWLPSPPGLSLKQSGPRSGEEEGVGLCVPPASTEGWEGGAGDPGGFPRQLSIHRPQVGSP